jgi:hypothetical protein
MHGADFFRHVMQVDVPWRGRSLRLPVFYRDSGVIQANHIADLRAVQRLLPSTRLHPLRVSPSHCMVSLLALEHRDTDLGPYNEFLVGVPVTLDVPSPLFVGSVRPLPQPTTVYVQRLPVTSTIARDVGIDVLSAPKFLADIRFHESDDHVACELAEGGRPILHLSVRKGVPQPGARERVDLITCREESLLRWQTVSSERGVHVTREASAARLQLGPHPLADELRRLHLGRVLETRYAPRFRMSLTGVLESLPRTG